ncbi:hypothetical protein B0G84_1786 [Paraburkholderia sp. BL8N3]|nr:hypothetical protein [Paraburkholderia sp. BL8N3]TCK43450.1 hypothetical protein B0G84_1786 [Paraburkholderia sp. BL8N3]
MKSYCCFYVMKGDEPSPLTRSIHLQAPDADRAAQLAVGITGCLTVTDVVRQGDVE